MKLQPWMIPGDLAPGDKKCVHADMSRIELHRIRSGEDPLFEMVYSVLEEEFGPAGELETRDVLRNRLGRRAAGIRYELFLLTGSGEFAAACDQTVILGEAGGLVVVHISHHLVAPEWRRTGLAGWLRAIPVSSAREVLAGRNGIPVVIVGEVECLDPGDAGNVGRLQAYEKAGFKKIHPHQVRYFQPDFRPPEMIDRLGGPVPIPLNLVVRRVGREADNTMSGREVRMVIEELYRMFACDFRSLDMQYVTQHLDALPGDEARVDLIPPTAL